MTIRGGASIVLTDPDEVLTLHAATLAHSMSSLYRGFADHDAESLAWRTWTSLHQPFEFERAAPVRESDNDELALLRTALSALRTAWIAEPREVGSLVMSVTIRDPATSELAVNSSEPMLAAYPGSLTLTFLGKTVKPVSWIVTLSLRGGISRSRLAQSLRDRLRTHALEREDIEVLAETKEITPAQITRASAIVVFVHGLLSTDIGTFDPLIDRVRFAIPKALRVGFAHNTLASIDVNAQELAQWLIDVVGFDFQTKRFMRPLPVVFVCHSRGGLVARAVASYLLKNAAWWDLLRGIVTFGTPHRGAALAEAPDQMAAVVAVVSAVQGSGTVMGVADVLAYIKNGGTFEGIRDLQPAEGAIDSSVSFLKGLQERELEDGTLPLLAFGGIAAPNSFIARVVGRQLGSSEHDHIVERSSTIPNALTGVGTACNHFQYFATTPGNKSNLDHAAQQIVKWLGP